MPKVSMTVNGRSVSGRSRAGRCSWSSCGRACGLTGTHVGCETGQCGACVVHLDGASAKACNVLRARRRRRRGHDHRGHGEPGRLALADPGGLPDASRPAVRLLHPRHGDERGGAPEGEPDPSEAEIREYLEGNICRCTGYHNIVKAIQAAAAELGADARAAVEGRSGRRRCPRTAGSARASSGARTCASSPARGATPTISTGHGQAHVAFLRSDVAHGRIATLDTAAAAAMPGVLSIFTGEDFASVGGIPCGWQVTDRLGQPMQEPKHPVLAHGKVRHVGDPVAAVVAETLAEARDAAEAIELDIEALPAVIDMAAALEDGAPKVHDEPLEQPLLRLGVFRGQPRGGRRGDRGGAARDHARSGQQPHGAERDGAALRHRRVRRGGRPAHALDHQPEPARDPPADGRLRARHPGAQAQAWWRRTWAAASARRSTTTPRRPSSPCGQGGRAAGEVDLLALGGLHIRRARPRPRDQDRARAPTRTGSSWRCAPTTLANMGAYLSTFAPCVPTYLHGTLMAGHYTTPLIYVNVQRGLHQHRAGRRLPRRRPAGGDLPDRAGHRQGGARARASTRSRSGARTSSSPTSSPTRPRSRSSTTPATTTRRWTSCWRSPTSPASRARRAESAAQGQAARPRALDLHRGLRHRALEPRRAARRAAPGSTRARRCG